MGDPFIEESASPVKELQLSDEETPVLVNRRRRLAALAATASAVTVHHACAARPAPSVATVPSTAPEARWLDALADEARGVERLHALVVMHAGEVIFSEAFRGPRRARRSTSSRYRSRSSPPSSAARCRAAIGYLSADADEPGRDIRLSRQLHVAADAELRVRLPHDEVGVRMKSLALGVDCRSALPYKGPVPWQGPPEGARHRIRRCGAGMTTSHEARGHTVCETHISWRNRS